MIKTVAVGRAPHAFDVLIGPRLLDRAGERLAPLAPGGRIAVVAGRAVADHHLERLAAALEAGGLATEAVVVEPDRLRAGAETLIGLGLGPGQLIATFGGGALDGLGDLARAAFAGGAGLVRIPTTLHAQVECAAAVGLPPPRLVLADLDILATLGPREVAAGYAEVLKYALLADPRLFSWLEAHGRDVLELQVPALGHAITRCVELKAQIVAAAPGGGALLELGHDFGRALCAATGGRLSHGEAVGLGCALAFQFSSLLGVCSADDAERATWNIAAAGLPVRLEEVQDGPFTATSLVERMAAPGGRLDLVLARGVGRAYVAEGVDPAALLDFLVAEGALP